MAELLTISPVTGNLACSFTGPLTEAQAAIAHRNRPRCPVCRRPVKITWRKVSLPGESPAFLPAERWECPAGCPRPRRSAWQQARAGRPPWQRR